MKQLLLILFLLVVQAPLLVYAHQIKTDHGVTVMLHVDPSDEPLSGTTTRMYLVFTNKDQINPDQCDCIVYIAPYSKLENIKEEGSRFDFSTQTERIMGSYSIAHIFPQHDVYAVVLEGSPKENASFEAFRIVYDLRVARGEEIVPEVLAQTQQDFMMTYRYMLSIALIVFILMTVGGFKLYVCKRQKKGNLGS